MCFQALAEFKEIRCAKFKDAYIEDTTSKTLLGNGETFDIYSGHEQTHIIFFLICCAFKHVVLSGNEIGLRR